MDAGLTFSSCQKCLPELQINHVPISWSSLKTYSCALDRWGFRHSLKLKTLKFQCAYHRFWKRRINFFFWLYLNKFIICINNLFIIINKFTYIFHSRFKILACIFFETLPLYYLKKLFCIGVQYVWGYHEPANWFLWVDLQPGAHFILFALRGKQIMSRAAFYFFVITWNVLFYWWWKWERA